MESATKIARDLHAAIADLKIDHEYSTVCSTVTVSIGLATMYPRIGLSEKQLVEAADQALYCAKNNGRNKVSVSNIRQYSTYQSLSAR